MSVEGMLAKYIGGLSEEDRRIHREAFLQFVQQVGACSEKVNVQCRDGRSFDGVFHTATPFAGKDFRVCVKAARATVRCEDRRAGEDSPFWMHPFFPILCPLLHPRTTLTLSCPFPM